jgi:hypothetical protein
MEGVEIVSFGRHLNSPDPELRALHIYVYPARGSAVESLFYAAQRIMLHLSSLSQSSADPWWLHRQCPHCEAAYRRLFSNPRIPLHHVYDKWMRFCLRHGILMNDALFAVSNRERVIALVNGVLLFKTATAKYSAEFAIYRDRADATIVKDDSREWSFTYNRHTDGRPYASAYDYLIRRIREFATSLVDATMACRYHNIYVNRKRVCPPETVKNPSSPSP